MDVRNKGFFSFFFDVGLIISHIKKGLCQLQLYIVTISSTLKTDSFSKYDFRLGKTEELRLDFA